jgi:thioesterase domain-containing protein
MQVSALLNETLTTQNQTDIYTHSNLTKLQMIYWVGQSLRPTSPLFNVIVAFRLHAPLDKEIISQAFASIVQQHDALRTVIREIDGIPQAIVLPEPPGQLQFEDFSNEFHPEATLQEWLTSRSQLALEITECAYDVVLIKLAEDEYCWYLNQHHLIADAASVFVIYRRVVRAYQELKERGVVEPVVDLPTFETYTTFEKEYRNSPRYKKSAVYWRNRLAQGIDPLRFYGRIPQKRSHNMQRMAFYLDAEQSQKLKETMERPGVLKMTYDLGMLNVLLTLYFAQLHYMTGNQRLATMIPFHNRPTAAMKRTVGLLMEICPLLVDLEAGETFATLTKKVNKSLQQTLVHYQYGTAVAMESSLLDLMFNYHHRPTLTFAGKPVEQKLIHPHAGSDSFALHIHEFEEDGALTFLFDFHEDVFTAAERERTLVAFETLVTAYLADEKMPLSELDWPEADLDAVDSPADQQKIYSDKPAYVAPRDELEHQIALAWQKILGLETISVNADFFDLGGNSWMAVRLFTELQAITGRNLPLATLFQAPTIAALAALINQGNDVQTWTSLVPIRNTGSKPPFFCIHGVTGDILWLKDLAELMDKDQPFYGIQARGLDGEATPFNRLEEMAAYYIQQIRHVQPAGPYYLGGYCMGGDIAYEVARQLQAEGDEVPILSIIDPPPADLSERAPLNGRFVIEFVQNSPHWLREFMRLGGSEITARVRRKGRLAARALWQKIRSTSDTAVMSATDVIDQAEDLPEHRQKLIESHLDALLHYNHAGYDGNVIVYEAQSRPLLNPGNHANEWTQYVNRPIIIRTVPGSHSSILHKPHVFKLANYLQDSLDRAREGRDSVTEISISY